MSQLTVDVQPPRVLHLRGRHDRVLRPALEEAPEVGRLGLEAEGRAGHVAPLGLLKKKWRNYIFLSSMRESYVMWYLLLYDTISSVAL